MALFSGCANKVTVTKPLPVIQKDKITAMNEDFDSYVLNTFHNIDTFKSRVEKKILNLKQKKQHHYDEFIYYK